MHSHPFISCRTAFLALFVTLMLFLPIVAFAYIPTIPEGCLELQDADLKWDRKYAVMSAPSKKSVRGAKGKAAVSTNGWVQIFGQEGNWLLIQYSVNYPEEEDEHFRIGYIENPSFRYKNSVEELEWDEAEGTVFFDTPVTDDPLGEESTLLTLPKGSTVTVLGEFGEDWYYVEGKYKGKVFRGFVSVDDIDVEDEIIDISTFG